MKIKALVLTLLLFPGTLLAQSQVSLDYWNVRSCTRWTNLENDRFWGCATDRSARPYLRTFKVPDVDQLVELIDTQRRQIEALEARVEALESNP